MISDPKIRSKLPADVVFVVGIDEAGRGPVAGPVSVGVSMIPIDFKFEDGFDLRDSKKHTPKQRDAWYEYLVKAKEEGKLSYAVGFTESERIDKEGIVPSVQSALCRALKEVGATPDKCIVLLDGGLKAPTAFIHQETIIRGDSKEPSISLAAIAAKVERDRIMITYAEKYPEYFFESHKGYGTKKHYEAIHEHGMCAIHRRSFLRNLK